MRSKIGIISLLALCLGTFVPAHAGDKGQGEKVVVSPPDGQVGNRFNITCVDFPEPAYGDVLYIAPAGTPDVDPHATEAQNEKILWVDYAISCYRNKGHFAFPVGPFAPGNYEVRVMTTLYNNDKRMEISTRTAFTVR